MLNVLPTRLSCSRLRLVLQRCRCRWQYRQRPLSELVGAAASVDDSNNDNDNVETTTWHQDENVMIDVSALAEDMRRQVRTYVAAHHGNNQQPIRMVGILADKGGDGSGDHPSSTSNEAAAAETYSSMIQATFAVDGLDYQLHRCTTATEDGPEAVESAIYHYNHGRPDVHGILVFYPIFPFRTAGWPSSGSRSGSSDYYLDASTGIHFRKAPPPYYLNASTGVTYKTVDDYLRDCVAPSKDVEGVCNDHRIARGHRELFRARGNASGSGGNGSDMVRRNDVYIPCTVAAVLQVLHKYYRRPTAPNGQSALHLPCQQPYHGCTVTIVNRSAILGRPLAALLALEGANVYSVDETSIIQFQSNGRMRRVDANTTLETCLRQSSIIVTAVPSANFQLDSRAICDYTTIIDVSEHANVDYDQLQKARRGLRIISRVGKVTIASLEHNLIRLHHFFEIRKDRKPDTKTVYSLSIYKISHTKTQSVTVGKTEKQPITTMVEPTINTGVRDDNSWKHAAALEEKLDEEDGEGNKEGEGEMDEKMLEDEKEGKADEVQGEEKGKESAMEEDDGGEFEGVIGKGGRKVSFEKLAANTAKNGGTSSLAAAAASAYGTAARNPDQQATRTLNEVIPHGRRKYIARAERNYSLGQQAEPQKEMAWMLAEIFKVDPTAKIYSANEAYKGTKTIRSIADYQFRTMQEWTTFFVYQINDFASGGVKVTIGFGVESEFDVPTLKARGMREPLIQSKRWLLAHEYRSFDIQSVGFAFFLCWNATDLPKLGRDRESDIETAMLYKKRNDRDDPRDRWYEQENAPRVEYRYKYLIYDVKDEKGNVLETMTAKVVEMRTDKEDARFLKAALMDTANETDERKYGKYVPTETLQDQNTFVELMSDQNYFDGERTSVYVMGIHQDIMFAKILKTSDGKAVSAMDKILDDKVTIQDDQGNMVEEFSVASGNRHTHTESKGQWVFATTKSKEKKANDIIESVIKELRETTQYQRYEDIPIFKEPRLIKKTPNGAPIYNEMAYKYSSKICKPARAGEKRKGIIMSPPTEKIRGVQVVWDGFPDDGSANSGQGSRVVGVRVNQVNAWGNGRPLRNPNNPYRIANQANQPTTQSTTNASVGSLGMQSAGNSDQLTVLTKAVDELREQFQESTAKLQEKFEKENAELKSKLEESERARVEDARAAAERMEQMRLENERTRLEANTIMLQLQQNQNTTTTTVGAHTQSLENANTAFLQFQQSMQLMQSTMEGLTARVENISMSATTTIGQNVNQTGPSNVANLSSMASQDTTMRNADEGKEQVKAAAKGKGIAKQQQRASVSKEAIRERSAEVGKKTAATAVQTRNRNKLREEPPPDHCGSGGSEDHE